MKHHPIATAFPLMNKSDIAALANDIKIRGLLSPGIVFEKMLLDGRNRDKACAIAKRKFRTTAYKGDDPIGFVVAQNNLRRHLSTSQRAMAATKLATLKWGVNRSAKNSTPATADAATKLGVSTASVRQARAVREGGVPELVKVVESGALPVSVAAELATMNKPAQRKAVKGGVDDMKVAAKEQKAAKKKADAGYDPNVFVDEMPALWSERADGVLAAAQRLPNSEYKVKLKKQAREYVCDRLSNARKLISKALARIDK